jgi:hypothetical protein
MNKTRVGWPLVVPCPQAVRDPSTGEVGFNVELGGYFSIKRNVMSIRWGQAAARGREARAGEEGQRWSCAGRGPLPGEGHGWQHGGVCAP